MKRFPKSEGLSRAVPGCLLARDAGFDVRALARLCGVSVRQLERNMEHDLAAKPKGWLNEQRLVFARHLLKGPESIKWVAYQLGYQHPAHFCRDFKKCYEMTPQQFRARIYPFRTAWYSEVEPSGAARAV